MVVIIKPLDVGIRDGRSGSCPAPEGFKYQDRDFNFRCYAIISTIVDILCWSDIIMQFFTGYENQEKRFIELRPKSIAKNYVFGPFFLIDLFNVLPRFTLRCFMDQPALYILGIQNIFCLAKAIRFFTLLNNSSRVLIYLGVTSKISFIAFYYSIITIFAIHYVTMFNIGMIRVIRVYFGYGACWKVIKQEQRTLSGTYMKYVFRSCAYLLATMLPRKFYKNMEIEESIVLSVSYIFGKFYIIISWIIIASTILQSRSLYMKYQMLIEQVQAYMTNKNVPNELKQKVLQYYEYKYHGKYYQEKLLTSLISTQLKKEMKFHSCSQFIDKVIIFNDLSVEDIKEVTKVLIPEIILASDTIYRAGNQGDCMYFIASGTIALYTPSGQELCHIQDGGYFGELAFLIESAIRPLSAIAIEHSNVYKMDRADFQKILMKNKIVHGKVNSYAKKLLQAAQKLEEAYMMDMLDNRYSTIM
ncbi:potassium/sodium hyperpolarization-activated cyclic nucleotide-gated channel 1-like [Diorhabda sublineata]|uniref:potassium/sodium hyperpolarization-activated cyclic nucleotide-gated channel 1-like n=1 Tax=Diorhabda sublineata TaxID=1163346 RepID=UPI0024E06D05|nr:potassium/sodium hyperpolarization-activated cyclic nucleotide-gated channel 1-like [Diorhabda sublineata]